MTVEMATFQVDSIGTMAGEVWTYLNDHGPVSLSKLARDLDAPRDLVMQGVGWLAREGKVKFENQSRKKLVSLCD